MSIKSRLIAKIYQLPPAETFDIGAEKNIEIPMPDGVVLLADHYYPHNLGERPTILVRSAYTKDQASFVYRLMAEQGFHVLVQVVRGTFGSGGEFSPFRQEHDDGLATIEWIKNQKWFNGKLALSGASYLGFTQWTVARDAGPELKAICTRMTSADFRSALYTGNAFLLDRWLIWTSMIHTQEWPMLTMMIFRKRLSRKLRTLFKHLPLSELDQLAFGKKYSFWREWLEHEDSGSSYWKECDYSSDAGEVSAPNHLVSGWDEIFLPNIIRNYLSLKHAGRNPYLTIGPWSHFSLEIAGAGMREELNWYRAHLLGERSRLRSMPVRIYVMGAKEWREYPEWPPAGYRSQRWYLQPGGCLTGELPPVSDPDHYHYDPNDPTPSGELKLGDSDSSKVNRILETRSDVLTYTSEILAWDVEVIGAVSAELYVRSSRKHTDFFVRLCDVEPSGKSFYVSEGVIRLTGSEVLETGECLKVIIELNPVAYRFQRGHKIRIHISSCFFPRFNRNLGSGEPLATGTAMYVADQSVYHEPAHPSAIILPAAD
jgi:putative CocE/NonD family hydrolase